MMAFDQNVPVFPIATLSAYYPLATVLDFDVTSAPAESIGTGIDRVCQDVMERALRWRFPLD